jgi:hypothetical protein
MATDVGSARLEARQVSRIAEIACPSCGTDGAQIIYRAPAIPVHSCVLLQSAASARSFPRRDLELAFCGVCGFIFNDVFDESVMGYSTNFEESQHFSPTFAKFARKLALEISDRCDLGGKTVFEIGCGKGEFLVELCSVADATGIGIDPGYRSDGHHSRGANVRFIVDHYGRKYKDFPADLILCRHTLEHIPAVREFVSLIREAIDGRKRVWVVFETPDAERVLRTGAFWDIYYEHCSYFSAGAHARLFRRESFDVTDLSLLYYGQYIVQYARPATSATTRRFTLEDDLAKMHAFASTFPIRVCRLQQMWRDRIRRAADRLRTIVVWGGGSKCVAFLTTLGLRNEIAAVIDVNPYKQGKFLPGSGHEVVAPTALTSINPHLVVVMNRVYVPEIKSELTRLRLEPEIWAL